MANDHTHLFISSYETVPENYRILFPPIEIGWVSLRYVNSEKVEVYINKFQEKAFRIKKFHIETASVDLGKLFEKEVKNWNLEHDKIREKINREVYEKEKNYNIKLKKLIDENNTDLKILKDGSILNNNGYYLGFIDYEMINSAFEEILSSLETT